MAVPGKSLATESHSAEIFGYLHYRIANETERIDFGERGANGAPSSGGSGVPGEKALGSCSSSGLAMPPSLIGTGSGGSGGTGSVAPCRLGLTRSRMNMPITRSRSRNKILRLVYLRW